LFFCNAFFSNSLLIEANMKLEGPIFEISKPSLLCVRHLNMCDSFSVVLVIISLYVFENECSFGITSLYQWDDSLPFFLYKPDHYVSHLIGHEGYGSILSVLKNKGGIRRILI